MTDTEVLHPATDRGENVAHPTVGRIVWVWNDPKNILPPAAGMVTSAPEPDDPTLKISIFVMGVTFATNLLNIPYGTKYERGARWQWPPRA